MGISIHGILDLKQEQMMMQEASFLALKLWELYLKMVLDQKELLDLSLGAVKSGVILKMEIMPISKLIKMS